ncbi:Hypothetical protein, putative [Bodo saltans]|uniref:Uncharacterized protein n=1 Tax=Bodo saltans TaxID=75058 RepID=A0A0S4JJ39_BODSA|nr:Hypothetical protein, putative [Bodo saltans]|eukprot:CUG91485.1 Hypothetical protein, putative [Bodo saltans]
MNVVKNATSLRSEGKFQEALEILSAAISTLPSSHIGMSKTLFNDLRYPMSSLRAARAYCNMKLGHFVEAQNDASSALLLVPEDVSMKLLSAHVHYVVGNFMVAAKIASEVIADCGGDDGSEETETLVKRASKLLKRCSVDRSFDASSPNVAVAENDSYDNDDEFESAWEPLAQSCSSCGKPLAATSRGFGTLAQSASSATAVIDDFLKHLMDDRLSSLIQSSLGHRARTHLPSVISALVTLHKRQLVDDATVSEVVVCQLVACCPDDKKNLQLLTAVLFGNSSQHVSNALRTVSQQPFILFGDLATHQAICASIVSKVSQFTASGNKQQRAAMERMMNTYQTIDLLLIERGLCGRRLPAGGSAFEGAAKELMNDVAENVLQRPMRLPNNSLSRQQPHLPESENLWDVSVAAALFPLCASLFVRYCGDAVQALFTSQQRRRPSGDSHTELITPTDMIDDEKSEEAQDGNNNSSASTAAPQHLFQFPTGAATCGVVPPFVHALAPLMRHYYLKRSSSDAQEFAREVLSLCAPKELQGNLRTALSNYLNLPV